VVLPALWRQLEKLGLAVTAGGAADVEEDVDAAIHDLVRACVENAHVVLTALEVFGWIEVEADAAVAVALFAEVVAIQAGLETGGPLLGYFDIHKKRLVGAPVVCCPHRNAPRARH